MNKHWWSLLMDIVSIKYVWKDPMQRRAQSERFVSFWFYLTRKPLNTSESITLQAIGLKYASDVTNESFTHDDVI